MTRAVEVLRIGVGPFPVFRPRRLEPKAGSYRDAPGWWRVDVPGLAARLPDCELRFFLHPPTRQVGIEGIVPAPHDEGRVELETVAVLEALAGKSERKAAAMIRAGLDAIAETAADPE